MRFAMLFALVGLALLGVVVSGDAQSALTAARERALKPKDTFKECANCPQMIVVPAGSFVMGSPDSEEGHSEAEAPQHMVTFARAFAVGQFAVTFEEWDACVAAGGCKKYRPADEGWGRGRQPVINVSWDDAELYVTWLSSRTGKAYRLLSEAEFEYVTRAGTTTPFWWGASISTEQANYDGRETYGGGLAGGRAREDDRCQLVRGQSVGTLPSAWQRRRVGRGLLARELYRGAGKWLGLGRRRLRLSRSSRWCLEQQPGGSSRSRPSGGFSRLSHVELGLPYSEDARELMGATVSFARAQA